MVLSLQKGLVIVTVLVGWCFLGNHGLEEELHELELAPSKCGVHAVHVPKSIFNITVDTSAFPKDCNPAEYLKTTGMHGEGSCVVYKWKHLLCDATIEKQEDICQEWAKIEEPFKPANATLDEFAAIEEGWTCENKTHYIAFISSCPENVTLSVTVQWGDLPGDENSFCGLVGERGKIFLEKLTLPQVIVGLVAAVVVFLGLSIWICAQCPCCPFHRWLKTFSEDEEDIEARRSHRRRTLTHRFNPDSIEEALLQQEDDERKARQRRRAKPVKKDKRPDQATIPE